MIRDFSVSLIEASPVPLNSCSLSRAKSFEIRVRRSDLEHISEVLTRISATLDRSQLGTLSEKGGGQSHFFPPQNQKAAPLLVTSTYPLEGGAA